MARTAERIKYADAGRKIRLSQDRLAESEFGRTNRQAWRVWAACVVWTASYSKGAERLYVTEIAKTARVRPDKASSILREFDRLGVFGWQKDRGRRSTGFLTLPALANNPLRGVEQPTVGPYLEEEDSSSGASAQASEQEDRGLGLDLPGRLTQSGAHTPTPKCVRDGCDEEAVPLTALCGEHLSQFYEMQDGYRRKGSASS